MQRALKMMVVVSLLAQPSLGQWIKQLHYSRKDCTGPATGVSYFEPIALGKEFTVSCTFHDNGVRGYYAMFECPTLKFYADEKCRSPLSELPEGVAMDTGCSPSWSKLSCHNSAPKFTTTTMYFSDAECTDPYMYGGYYSRVQYGYDSLFGCFDMSRVAEENGRFISMSEMREVKGGKLWVHKYAGVSNCSGTVVETRSHLCGGCEKQAGGMYYTFISGLCGVAEGLNVSMFVV
eukprot:TRINITY_DN10901_c0_g1_i1.p1 TRINITY_DN10901_c0_g1~~TRINITY_DN10901_c0_g1_i1.p1  ORF type:complete len:234 (-),score=32.40 TRINITY_DN10901_c0_g1_i1:432-1133(-)